MLALHYLVAKDTMDWVYVWGNQVTYLAQCIQAVVQDLIRIAQKKKIRKVSGAGRREGGGEGEGGREGGREGEREGGRERGKEGVREGEGEREGGRAGVLGTVNKLVHL